MRRKLQQQYDLPDAVMDGLQVYVDNLLTWNKTINLIGKSTEADVWQRHVAESLWLLPMLPKAPGTIADLGTGAGLPGMILAIATPHKIALVESDIKKCSFLRNVSRETSAQTIVINERIEKTPVLNADVVTARACAPLEKLLVYTQRHIKPGGMTLVYKGQNWQQEIETAKKQWTFTYHPHKVSMTSVVLEITNIHAHS